MSFSDLINMRTISAIKLLIVIIFANNTYSEIKQAVSLNNQITFRYSFKDLTKDYSWHHYFGILNRLWFTNKFCLGLGANYSKLTCSYHYDEIGDTFQTGIPALERNWWQINADISYEYKVVEQFNPSFGLFSHISILNAPDVNSTAWWPSLGFTISNRFYFDKIFFGLNGYGVYEFCEVRSLDERTGTYIKQIPLQFGISIDFGLCWSYSKR
jgi:hypothetical protein